MEVLVAVVVGEVLAGEEQVKHLKKTLQTKYIVKKQKSLEEIH